MKSDFKLNKEVRMAEFRSVDNNEGKMIIEGYAIVYEQPATHRLGDHSFTEVIKRGALNNTDMSDVPLKYNHNDNVIIMARTRNNSLQLIKDNIGLRIRAELIDTQSNRDIYKSIQAQLIDKMSFAFTVDPEIGDSWSGTIEDTVREVKSINKLFDVSVVDTPFYDTTSVYARSLELLEGNLKQLESFDLQKRKLKLKYGEKGVC